MLKTEFFQKYSDQANSLILLQEFLYKIVDNNQQ